MTNTTHTGANFDASYLRTWTELDADQRRTLIEQMWTPHGSLYTSSPALTVIGTADIAEYIGHVHNDRIAGQSLTFSYGQRMKPGDALLLRWSMATPNGGVVGCEVGTVLRDVDSRVTRTYMFIGVN